MKQGKDKAEVATTKQTKKSEEKGKTEDSREGTPKSNHQREQCGVVNKSRIRFGSNK